MYPSTSESTVIRTCGYSLFNTSSKVSAALIMLSNPSNGVIADSSTFKYSSGLVIPLSIKIS